MILVGNKCDLRGQRVVSTAEGLAYAESCERDWGCRPLRFFETSAKQSTSAEVGRSNITDFSFRDVDSVRFRFFFFFSSLSSNFRIREAKPCLPQVFFELARDIKDRLQPPQAPEQPPCRRRRRCAVM
jgi:GTPase SAR1 family protein